MFDFLILFENELFFSEAGTCTFGCHMFCKYSMADKGQ